MNVIHDGFVEASKASPKVRPILRERPDARATTEDGPINRGLHLRIRVPFRRRQARPGVEGAGPTVRMPRATARTATRVDPHETIQENRSRLAWRMAVVVAAAVCAGVGLPTPVTATLGALALALTVEVIATHWSYSGIDGLILGVGALLVGLVLVGLLLDVVPGGIDRISWAAGSGVAESGVMAFAFTRRRRRSLPRARLRASAGWYGVGLILLVAGFTISVAAERHAESPPVALSVVGANASHPTIEVTSGHAAGTFTLVQGSWPFQQIVASGFAVSPGHPKLFVLTTPRRARVTVRLLEGSSVSGHEVRRIILQGR